jgi:DNA-binding Lrp family transcriptional regulator
MSEDQEPLEPWWSEIDDAVLGALAAARGRLTLVEIAVRVGISEDATRSVVAMLAEQGKVQIVAVELSSRPPLAVAPPRARTDPAPSAALGDLRRATP